MKKYVITTVLFSIVALITGSLIAKANLEVPESEASDAIEAIVSFESSKFLNSMNLDNKIVSIDEKTNSFSKEKFYTVETKTSMLKVDSTTHSVTSYLVKQVNCNFKKSSSKEDAKRMILSKYEELGLPEEYDLVYLEEFDDYCWEADFQKKYDNVYNMYEAVKIFFVPETEEIISLNKFNEEYKETKDEIITAEIAKEIAKTVLDSNKKISDTKLTIIKGNSYFKENSDTSLHKAYVVQTSDEEYVYVDAVSGEIIGGDIINE